jgi:hypothetical protein
MKNVIVKGDFSEGSNIDFINYFSKEDIGISWMEGWKTKSFALKGQIDRVEIINQEEGLSPLEGGIIGGSVAGLNGFLAGYLSLAGDEDGFVFVCYLKDGRYFAAHTSPEIYNKLLEFSYY